jgi:hypothetical protein
MTDEQTGLPPLDEPTEADTLWAMVFGSGQADVLSPIDGSPRGCLVLSVRGLNGPDWAQMHLAFPHGTISRLREHLDSYLAEYPEVTS